MEINKNTKNKSRLDIELDVLYRDMILAGISTNQADILSKRIDILKIVVNDLGLKLKEECNKN